MSHTVRIARNFAIAFREALIWCILALGVLVGGLILILRMLL
jgi:hypothetical protein